MQLVLDTSGLSVTKKDGTLLIKSEKSSRVISPAKLESIAITANVTLSAAAIRLAIKHEIPILFFDRIGKAKARLWSPYFASIATLRRQQIRFFETTEATAWMVELFNLKSAGQINNLKYIIAKRKGLNLALGQAVQSIKRQTRNLEPYRQMLVEESRQQMMGIEGAIARIYWQAVGNSVPREYSFQARSRRPAKDEFNAAINYLYGMLYTVVEGALFAVGLDPHLGLFHADEYNKPTLAFDLIEPFRPWVDQLLIEQCYDKKVEKNFFTKNQFGLFLNKHGKAYIIPLFNDFLRSKTTFLNQESTIKNHIYHLAGRLSQRIRATVG